MQKHLIVVAHPVEDSFTMSVERDYLGESIRVGHDVRVHDLYRMGFDPVLSAQELTEQSDVHVRMADVVIAQKDVLAADVVTVVYPLWWMAMPAMMKGYIDRVFSRGFAYETQPGGVHGLLSGRRAVVVTVSAAPLASFMADGPVAGHAAAAGYARFPRIRFRSDRAPAFRRSRPGHACCHGCRPSRAGARVRPWAFRLGADGMNYR